MEWFNYILLGLAIYIFLLLIAYYYLTMGLVFYRRYYFLTGLILLITATIIPPFLFTQVIEFLFMNLMKILNQYPILHLLFFGFIAIIMVRLFYDFVPEKIIESKISQKVIAICLGLMAAFYGYYFFLIFISIGSSGIATLILSIIISIFILHLSFKSAAFYKIKK